MAFSDKQLRALKRNVEERYIRSRELDGRELSYLEGWYAISAANRIFGFDGWNRETVESRCVLARENRGTFVAVYIAKVRITVVANGSIVVREGHGTGEGRGNSAGVAHDTALKAAETDATKRALTTFGRPFGLELYRSDRKPRGEPSLGIIISGVPVRRPAAAVPSGTAAEPSRAAANPARRAADAEAPPAAVTSGRGATCAGQTSTAAAGEALSTSVSQLSSPGSTYIAPEEAPPLATPDAPVFAPANPHPDDGTPIPRPSTYFGRERYHQVREPGGALVRQAAEEALRAEKAAAPPALQPARIDKSVLALPEPKRLRDKAHLQYVAGQPCLICGRQPADPHHLRFAQPRAIGLKVSDEFTVPLCRSHHRNLHQSSNERRWWENFRIDPMLIAGKLWDETHPERRSQSPSSRSGRSAAHQAPDVQHLAPAAAEAPQIQPAADSEPELFSETNPTRQD